MICISQSLSTGLTKVKLDNKVMRNDHINAEVGVSSVLNKNPEHSEEALIYYKEMASTLSLTVSKKVKLKTLVNIKL